MNLQQISRSLFCILFLGAPLFAAQQPAANRGASLRLRLVPSHAKAAHPAPTFIWLEPLGNTPNLPFLPQGNYRLLQKNRTFTPHLQIIPTGSVVEFPNQDPFFHNVFSLFDGKRFDLGLYEAGSSKSVTFSREGISYIFCNIHPKMSAVIVTLSTPLYAIADPDNRILIRDIPPGDYRLHLWVEGVPQSLLSRLDRRIHLDAGSADLGEISVPAVATHEHENKFGKPYDQDRTSPY
jgi:hypothetical protein